ncbi:MAG: site-specific DNA-methyltransferase [Candidatus Thermoplasmatota archaeon]|nr:site-specific DNA-methyltransferase [Candidatus Thermoplasmatota archaeon]
MSTQYIIADSRNLEAEYHARQLLNADVIVTSPPYFDVKRYDQTDGQIGYKQTYEEYLTDTVSVIQQCYNVSSQHATMWLVVDTIQRNHSLLPIPFDINNKLSEKALVEHLHTWVLRDVIIWNRTKNIPWNWKGHLKHEFEYILMFSKDNEYKYYLDRLRQNGYNSEWWKSYPERYSSGGKPPSNIWEFMIPTRGWGNGYQQHLCPFPFPLVERILLLSSDEGDYVLDPFAGSGSVLAMAEQMGRNGIGFDISQKYKDSYESKVRVGAKHHWENRVVEISNEQNKLNQFRSLNQRLRKIKAGIKLGKLAANEIPNVSTITLALDQPDNGLEVIVFFQGITDIPDIQKVTKKTSIDFGLNITLKFASINDNSFKSVSSKVFYAYKASQIYKYYEQTSVASILEQKRNSVLLSDISVNIEDPSVFINPVGNMT